VSLHISNGNVIGRRFLPLSGAQSTHQPGSAGHQNGRRVSCLCIQEPNACASNAAPFGPVTCVVLKQRFGCSASGKCAKRGASRAFPRVAGVLPPLAWHLALPPTGARTRPQRRAACAQWRAVFGLGVWQCGTSRQWPGWTLGGWGRCWTCSSPAGRASVLPSRASTHAKSSPCPQRASPRSRHSPLSHPRRLSSSLPPCAPPPSG